MLDRLVHLRRLWGWSQKLVAEMLRVSRSSLSRWERGTVNPRSANEEKIAALVRSLEEAASADSPETPPSVEVVGGDTVSGDKTIGRDAVRGDATTITTSDGTIYIIRESLVVIITDPEQLSDVLPPPLPEKAA
jgi:transcriptional regulator with XRE-family HTH domain